MAMPISAGKSTNFAANGTGTIAIRDTDGHVENLDAVPVNYGVNEKFTLTIPDQITFYDSSLYATGKIEGRNMLLKTNQTLVVTVSSLNGWYMKEEAQPSVTLKYGMALSQDGEEVENGASVFEALPQPSGLQDKTVTLHCKRASTNQAGTYKDTLTFTCQIVEKK